MNALVIPSCRQEQLTAFFEAWAGIGGWDCVYVVDDSATLMLDCRASDRVTTRLRSSEVAETGVSDFVFSRRDSACRSLGMYQAWKDGAEYILTLDDDVRPHHMYQNIFGAHVVKMAVSNRAQTSVQGLIPRGLPQSIFFRDDVKASMGTWSGVPDLWAKDMLEGYPKDYKPPLGSRIVADGEFIPVCGMNFCVHRDAMPLCYFPPMGEGQPYQRYDDIWMGLILKMGFDALGWKLSVGEPFVRHERASDVHKSAIAEAKGIAANYDLWNLAANFNPDRYVAPARVMMSILSDHVAKLENPYFATMSAAMRQWSDLFQE